MLHSARILSRFPAILKSFKKGSQNLEQKHCQNTWIQKNIKENTKSVYSVV